MGITSNVILIFSIIGIGFGAGLHLELIDDSATMYRIQNLIPKSLVYSDGLPYFDLAFMSGQSNGLISHASVGFGLGSVVIDPDETIKGDEYIDNRITECIFHSEEDIDEPICIVCRILDTHEKCVDQWLDLTEFDHGALLSNEDGFTNAVIPGVTISAIANSNSQGGANAVMIFSGDGPGNTSESPFPDPDLRASGRCPDCAGKSFAVIAERTDGGADGVVDFPDDNGNGGIQTWVFDQPWFVESFVFVDYEEEVDGMARAFSDANCSVLVKTALITNENTGDAQLKTIFLNANNVRCLEFEYISSGGITDLHLKCIKKMNKEDIIATGIADLPDGYTASSVLPIELLHGGVDVFEAQSVKIEIGKSLIDFDGLAHGDSFAAVKGYLLSNFGITLEIDGDNGVDSATIFDTNHLPISNVDPDLNDPLFLGDPNNPNVQGPQIDADDVGNILIMEETSSTSGNPNDSGAGGIIRFKSTDTMSYSSIDVVDHDNAGGTSVINTYSDFACTQLIDTYDIVEFGFENSVQTVQINDDGVRCLEIFYKDSGGFTNLLLGCLGAFHKPPPPPPAGLDGCTPGYWKQEQHFDDWVGFLTTDTVGSVFNQATSATSGSTLLQALSFMGGPGTDDAERILMRAAVAGILSASNPNVGYPSSVPLIITSVNNAIASGDRDTMLNLKNQIDADNNIGCPLNGGNPPANQYTQTTSNDSEERVSNGDVSLGSSDLELHMESDTDGYVAMRFTNVPIPQGATILDARIQFHVDEERASVLEIVTFRGDDSNDSQQLTNTNSDISSRDETDASVNWSVPHWAAVHDEGLAQLSPDLSSIVQEIVDRGGWVSGSDITIMIKAWPDNSGERVAESSNGESSNAPTLTITFN